ncbi:MAG TPA: histidine phosphatase family protein [Solirubrobacteraceae bacterium]|jgi:broad specificity phosphatase PhoE|nr:histidine phosphatase family protein [Solirubrobacteraceae bacterium]
MADEIWLLRHAETEWSRTGKHTGRTDIPLTDKGREVARALRARLEGRSFALVLCSPLSRARETAQLAGLEPSALDDDLLEWDYGEYEGLTTPEIRAQRPDWYLWRDGAPGGESPDDAAARCDRVIARLRSTEGDVAVVAHGHVLRAIAARWVDAPVALGGNLHLGTGAISVLAYEREISVISRWNG